MVAKTLRQVRRLIIAVVGFTVLAIGVVLIVLPGPAFLVIPAGLAILSIEFVWAKNLLERLKRKLGRKGKAEPPANMSATETSRSRVPASGGRTSEPA